MTPSPRKDDRFVSATDIASLFHCEQKVMLDRRLGETVTREQLLARTRGRLEHEIVDGRARAQHNKHEPAPSRGPCFIATHVYGGADPRTDQLRSFRDQVLKRHPLGRAGVALYYRHSPAVVRRLEGNPTATWMVARLIDVVRLTLTPWIGGTHDRLHRQPVRPPPAR